MTKVQQLLRQQSRAFKIIQYAKTGLGLLPYNLTPKEHYYLKAIQAAARKTKRQ
jgi:hypothetical protein